MMFQLPPQYLTTVIIKVIMRYGCTLTKLFTLVQLTKLTYLISNSMTGDYILTYI